MYKVYEIPLNEGMTWLATDTRLMQEVFDGVAYFNQVSHADKLPFPLNQDVQKEAIELFLKWNVILETL